MLRCTVYSLFSFYGPEGIDESVVMKAWQFLPFVMVLLPWVTRGEVGGGGLNVQYGVAAKLYYSTFSIEYGSSAYSLAFLIYIHVIKL